MANKGLLKTWSKMAVQMFDKHSSEILNAAGITAMLMSSGFSILATKKAMFHIWNKENELGRKLTKKEVVAEVWKYYILPAATAVTGTACVIGAQNINTRKNVALLAAYTLSEDRLDTFQKKLEEHVEPAIVENIHKEVMQEEVTKDRGTKELSDGTFLDDDICYDPISGRYFRSTRNKIDAAVNTINASMLSNSYASLNDFYYELDISNTQIGDDLGWNISEGRVSMGYDAVVYKDRPCLVLVYHKGPHYDFAY